jgi:phage tail protein X
MAVETLTVTDPFTPLDLLLYRRFKRYIPDLLEQTLELNAGLASFGVYLPLGTRIIVEPPLPITKRSTRQLVSLFD